MKRINDHIRHRLLTRAGVDVPRISPEELLGYRETEWSDEFEQYMRNRLAFGRVRFGCLRDESTPEYDYLASAKKRIDAYALDHNLEHLVDIANLALCEFIAGRHPDRHFTSVDDSNLHQTAKH